MSSSRCNLEAASRANDDPARSSEFALFWLLLLPVVALIFSCSLRDDARADVAGAARCGRVVHGLPYVGFHSWLACRLCEVSGTGRSISSIPDVAGVGGDIAAYYVGTRDRKTQASSAQSVPGKTWEGSIASVVGAVIVAVLLFHYVDPIADWLIVLHMLLRQAPDFSSPGWSVFASGSGVACDPVCRVRQRRRTTRRPGGVGISREARALRTREPASWPRRRTRSHRCPAFRAARRPDFLCSGREEIFRLSRTQPAGRNNRSPAREYWENEPIRIPSPFKGDTVLCRP